MTLEEQMTKAWRKEALRGGGNSPSKVIAICAEVAEAEADHFYDEAFHNDPYLLGRVRSEIDRMRSVAR